MRTLSAAAGVDLLRNLVTRSRGAHRVPRDDAFDSTLALVREGYPFIWNRCRRLRSDIFTARILGRPAVCVHGPEAAVMFYDETKLRRAGAIPRRVVTSLFGKQAVHTLDDEAHRHRKSALMSLMTPSSLDRLMTLLTEQWQLAIRSWETRSEVVVFDEAQRILTAAVCEWAGVPLGAEELSLRAHQLGEMVDAFGGVGPRLWRGKLARAAAERWIERCVRDVRRGRIRPEPGSALAVLSHYRDLKNRRLSARTAAVEVLNVIRPTSAIAWYVADAALALHDYPDTRRKLQSDEPAYEDYALLFMQEVRRFYPFTPYLGAMVRTPFAWRGHSFKPGTLVLLDVYGQSHDPRLWSEPDRFWPERFHQRPDNPFDFIPQGGGLPQRGHRCAGERVTMLSLALAARFLARGISYDVVPGQDLSLDLTRMPTRPASGVVIRNVRSAVDFVLDPPRSSAASGGQQPNP